MVAHPQLTTSSFQIFGQMEKCAVPIKANTCEHLEPTLSLHVWKLMGTVSPWIRRSTRFLLAFSMFTYLAALNHIQCLLETGYHLSDCVAVDEATYGGIWSQESPP